MDILISSNLERMLYYLSDGDCELVASLMEQLAHEGRYEVPPSSSPASKRCSPAAGPMKTRSARPSVPAGATTAT